MFDQWWAMPVIIAAVYALYYLSKIKERLDLIADIMMEVHSGTSAATYTREQRKLKWHERDRW